MSPKVKKIAKKEHGTKAAERREIIYEHVHVEIHAIGNAKGYMDPLTAEDAKFLLGWEEEGEEKFGNDYLLTDEYGKKIRCKNNSHNRRFSPSLAKLWQGEILKGNWRFNLETLIIGQTGETISSQHRLVALILAAQAWAKDPERWSYWKEEPAMECLVAFGCSEEDATVNTIDTGRPRSLTDVIDRSEYFAGLPHGERFRCSRMTEYAIRLLTQRTGADLNSFALKVSIADRLDFLTRHPRILECVKHIHTEDGDKKQISRYCSPGYAAGLLYLMASSQSDPDAYRLAESPSEATLDWSRWSEACDWWVTQASATRESPLIQLIGTLMEDEGGISNAERWALIVTAWCQHIENEKITVDSLKLEYELDPEGGRILLEHPAVGGIDLGNPKEADEEVITSKDPTEAEIKERATKVRNGNGCKPIAKEKKSKNPVMVPARAGTDWAVGDVAWVRDADNEHFLGKVIEEPFCTDGENGEWLVMVHSDDPEGDWEVKLKDLTLPAMKNKMPKTPAPQKKTGKPKEWCPGDLAWVADGENPWRGRIIELAGKTVRLRVENGFQGAGSTKPAKVSDLSVKQPIVS